LGACCSSSEIEISDISTKSKSRIFFINFGGREAAGLYGPVAEMAGMPGVSVGGSEWGLAADAAAASRSSPDEEGVKMGS
jgi:hypothetical protein